MQADMPLFERFRHHLTESVDTFLYNYLETYGLEKTDEYMAELELLRRDFLPVVSFGATNITDYIEQIIDTTAKRDLIFHVWTDLNIRLPSEDFNEINKRFANGAVFIQDRKSQFFQKEWLEDMPHPEAMSRIYEGHRWLYVPAMIAMYYDFTEAELRIAEHWIVYTNRDRPMKRVKS